MSKEELFKELEKLYEDIKKMANQYPHWLENLSTFKGYPLLYEYLKWIREIEGYNTLKDKNKRENITHLLYNLMHQHSFSFLDITHKLKSGEIRNLEDSYNKSLEIAKKLNDDSKSFAWYSNMKLPMTYIGSSSVKRHYKELSEIFESLPLVKVRRIHLFYESFLPEYTNDINKEYNTKQLSALFTTLFVEFLMRVESKVVIVKDVQFEDYKNYFYDFQGNITNNKGFLLDFALYHNEMREYDGVYKKNYTSLFADFCYEMPNPNPKGHKLYASGKVYNISDYNIFHLLRSYYISLWEKDDYVEYLKNIESTSSQVEIYNSLQVLSIHQFWHEFLSGEKFDKYFDKDTFKYLYNVNINSTNRFEKYKEKDKIYNSTQIDNINKNIRDDIFKMIDDISDVSKIDLEDYFQDYFFRDKKDELYSQLKELYNIYDGNQKIQDFSDILKRFIQDNNIKF